MKTTLRKLSTSAALLLSVFTAQAQNPIAQTCFSTDPAPMVHGDRLYVFTGHDEEKADFFWMNDWRLFSTTDMVNWQDHGSPLSLFDFEWADDRAWAPQVIERNGKFYFYVPAHSKISGGMAIGVAVADNIDGPYIDPLGKPLYEDGKWDHIDPTVWIDDDGQAYIAWGNPKYYSAKLSEDMIHLASEVKCDATVKRYTEGPWLHKQRSLTKQEIKQMKLSKKELKASAWGKWFLIYAAGGVPECIAYSESDSPQGPWNYVGEIMPQTNDTKSFTNHSGIIEYKGHNYFFYHTGWLPGGGGFGRSACVEEFQWQRDGRLPQIKPTREGVAPIATLNPYQRVEAETMADSKGIRSEWNLKQKRVWVSDIHNDDWVKVREVDFQDKLSASSKIEVTAASALLGGTIEVRTDSIKGDLIATIDIPRTGGWEEWQTIQAPVKKSITGKRDLFFVFRGMKGSKLFNLDSWRIR